MTFNGPPGVISQKVELFITAATRTPNLTKENLPGRFHRGMGGTVIALVTSTGQFDLFC
jgi:hypothetical protein